MGTRGAIGFRTNGSDKTSYNHFDSYPSGLGAEVVGFVKKVMNLKRGGGIQKLRKIAEAVEMVKEDVKPTEEQKEHCRKMGTVDLRVSGQSEDEWYCLLRNAQGNMDVYRKGLKYMIDSGNFLADSLFCEYAYIINVDDGVLEFYKGFNKNRQAEGRYAHLETDRYEPDLDKDGNFQIDEKGNRKFKIVGKNEYCGVELVKTYLFDDIRVKEVADIVKNMEVESAEEEE